MITAQEKKKIEVFFLTPRKFDNSFITIELITLRLVIMLMSKIKIEIPVTNYKKIKCLETRKTSITVSKLKVISQ